MQFYAEYTCSAGCTQEKNVKFLWQKITKFKIPSKFEKYWSCKFCIYNSEFMIKRVISKNHVVKI